MGKSIPGGLRRETAELVRQLVRQLARDPKMSVAEHSTPSGKNSVISFLVKFNFQI